MKVLPSSISSILVTSLYMALASFGFCGCKTPQALQKTSIPLAAKAQAVHAPVIRRLDQNPAMKIILSAPANYSGTVQSFRCSLEGFEDVQRIDVYKTGATPFAADEIVSSFEPLTQDFSISCQMQITPGVQFVWFSIVLKDGASLDRFIDLRVSRFRTGAGGEVIVEQPEASAKKHIGVAVRKAGDNGVNTYRIPGIVQTNTGTLIAVYDVRYKNSGDLPGYIDVGMSRSTDGGQSWEPMKIITSMGGPDDNSGAGDPSILFDQKTKTIWVAALWSKGNRSIAGSIGGISPDSTGQFLLVSSGDDGHTWSEPLNITSQIKDPQWKILFQGPGRGIVMENGKLVFPAQYWDSSKVPYSTIVYSEDHGRTWKGKINGPKSNTTESQVVETTPGTLMLNMRDNRGGYRSVATTTDMGARWTEHSTSYNALPDPVCMGSLIKAKVNVDGEMKDVLFFSNPATRSGRFNMTVKASLDMGKTWLPANELLIDERSCFGYSCLTKIDENNIGLLYEGIRDLYFVKIPVSEVIRQSK